MSCYPHSQDVSKDLMQLNTHLKRQNFYSASVTSLGLIDRLLVFLEGAMLDSIVNIDGYKLIYTNTFSRIMLENGNYDFELYS